MCEREYRYGECERGSTDNYGMSVVCGLQLEAILRGRGALKYSVSPHCWFRGRRGELCSNL